MSQLRTQAGGGFALCAHCRYGGRRSAGIYPYLGSSRLSEVVDRHGADLIVHDMRIMKSERENHSWNPGSQLCNHVTAVAKSAARPRYFDVSVGVGVYQAFLPSTDVDAKPCWCAAVCDCSNVIATL